MLLPLIKLQRVSRLRSKLANHGRTFHATRKTEILPIVAVVVFGTFARYSYRALKRIDDEWIEYQESLREYRLEHGLDVEEETIDKQKRGSSSKVDHSSFRQLKHGILGIDLGTCNIRISHRPPSSSSENNPQPTILINREGGRSTPNKIYMDGAGHTLVGRLAQEKMFEKHRQVLNPNQLLWNERDDFLRNNSVHEVISSAVKQALETLPMLNDTIQSTIQKDTLFSIDPTIMAGQTIRPIFTYPQDHSDSSPSTPENNYIHRYKAAVKSLSYPETLALFVPQAVAIVTAAEYYKLSSRMNTQGPLLVIDVGGSETQLSLVEKENKTLKVVYAYRLENFGGETLIEALMNHVVNDFYGKDMSDIQDGMALQRVYTAASSAVLELSNNRTTTRAQINIPYLTVDEKFQPRHLDMGISKQILEAEFASIIKERVLLDAKRKQILSSSFSDPKDLPTLMASVILKLLETAKQNPFALRCIIIAGGGTRSPIIQSAIKEGIAQLAGEQYVNDKVVIPKDEQVEELGALGAALMGSNEF